MDAELLRARVKALLEQRELDPVPLAEHLGRGRDYISDLLNGRKDSLATNFLVSLAKELQVPIEVFLDKDAEMPAYTPALSVPSSDAGKVVDLNQLRQFITDIQRAAPKKPAGRTKSLNRDVPIMGEVAAGLWREAIDHSYDGTEATLPVNVTGYERAQLYALKVVGNSMNLFYPAGRYVVVAPTAEAGVRYGDHVIVQRSRAGLVELTIKELVDDDGRIALWPRSSDPEFQEPVYLQGNEADQSSPKIIGVVVADFGRRDRPTAPIYERHPRWAE